MDIADLQQRLQATLGKQFTVGPLLGQGGFAVVFRAKDELLRRDVAIKVLDVQGSPSPTLSERFVREAQTIARLEHPNIVPIYEVGQQEGLLYIVMRCVDGPSLRQLVGAHQRLSVADAGRVARQVADALQYAHSEGVVHRDVKPDNILLDKRGRVFVTDFGIAKAAQAASAAQLTTEGMIIGTPQYMSPEQAAGDVVDGRSDIYSLGIVLYQMLTGNPPFDGQSSASILAKQLTATPTPIRDLRSDVPRAFELVLDRMLAKDPAARYQTAAEVSQALVAALPTAARNTLQVRSSWFARALRWLVGLGMAGCLIALAFGAGGLAVFWFAVSRPAAVLARAPVPDSLARVLADRRAIGRGDTIDFAFAPGGYEDSILLVVTRRRVAVVSPHRVRGYARDSVAYTFDLNLKEGLSTRFILTLIRAGRDTVYPELPLRGAWDLARYVQQLLPADSAAGPGFTVGTQPNVGPIQIRRRP